MSRLFLLGLVCALAMPARAQLTIAPIFQFLDQRQPFGSYDVINETNRTYEVVLSFDFGYTTASDSGAVYTVYEDSTALAETHAMDGWVSAYPRRFVIGPGQRQIVRLLARAPADAAGNVYWTRAVFTSAAVADAPAASTPAQAGTQLGLNVQFRQNLPVFYGMGQASSAARIQRLDVMDDGPNWLVLPHIERTVGAPYLGTATLRITDANGQVVHERQMATSIFTTMRQRFEVPKTTLPPGTYRFDVTLRTGRSDLPAMHIPQAPAATFSAEHVIEG